MIVRSIVCSASEAIHSFKPCPSTNTLSSCLAFAKPRASLSSALQSRHRRSSTLTLTSTTTSFSTPSDPLPTTSAQNPQPSIRVGRPSPKLRFLRKTSPLEGQGPNPPHRRLPQRPAPPTAELGAEVLSRMAAVAAQPPHYATILIHARPYLVTEGDVLRLPFRMPFVQVGDVLRFTRAATLGSRDYTVRGAPVVDPRLFRCRAIVAGVESEPLRIKEKTKRRNRRVKHVKSKHRYTELIIRELTIAPDLNLFEPSTLDTTQDQAFHAPSPSLPDASPLTEGVQAGT